MRKYESARNASAEALTFAQISRHRSCERGDCVYDEQFNVEIPEGDLRLPPERRPQRGIWWCKFYLWRNAMYIGLAYVYLTKSAEMLLRSLGFDPASPVLALKCIVLVALLGYAGARIIRSVRTAPPGPVGPLSTRG